MDYEKRKKQLVNAVYFGALGVLCIRVLKAGLPVAAPFLLGALVSKALAPVVRFFTGRFGLGHKGAAAAVVFVSYVLFGCFAYAFFSRSFLFLLPFLQRLPFFLQERVLPILLGYLGQVEQALGKAPFLFSLVSKERMVSVVQSGALEVSTRGVGKLMGLVQRVPSLLLGGVFTLCTSFYVSVHYEKIAAGIKGLPLKGRRGNQQVAARLWQVICTLLKAQCYAVLVSFCVLGVGFLLLFRRQMWGFAFFIALVDALPLVGTSIVFVPWILFESMAGHPALALGLLALFFVCFAIKSAVETKAMGKEMGLGLFPSVCAIYIGGKCFGILGMVAAPFLVVLMRELFQLQKKT